MKTMKIILVLMLMIFLTVSADKRRKFPPELLKSDQNKVHSPQEGSIFKLRCKVSAFPRPFLVWYKDGQKLTSRHNERYRISRHSLTIEDVQPSDSGEYSCHAVNELGEVWKNVTVNVKEEIKEIPSAPIIDGPSNTTAQVGENVQLSCRIVYSMFQPHIQWLRHYSVNGSYLSPSGEPYVHILEKSGINESDPEVLHLYNVGSSDSGWYTCLVSNAVGRKYQSAWLEVVPSPTILPDFGAGTECPGGWSTYGTKCFYISRDRFNWIDSQMTCRMLNSRLVQISSEEENEYVKSLIISTGELSSWIGVTDLEEEGTFRYADEDADMNFNDFENESSKFNEIKNCVEMRASRASTWKPVSCQRKLHFICELQLSITN